MSHLIASVICVEPFFQAPHNKKKTPMALFFFVLLLATAIVESHRSPGHNGHIPNVHAVHVDPSVSCTQAVLAAMQEANCRVLFRTNVQTNLISMCSYEVLNHCRHSAAIVKISGFVASYRVKSVSGPKPIKMVIPTTATTRAFNPQTEPIHSKTGVLDARYKLGLRGANIKVAIIDTGVYYLHPALGGGFGPGFKVAFGYDLVGDNYNGQSSSIVPDNDPFDNCSQDSHGTHVAGIVAANALNITKSGFIPAFPFTGVAPDATLGAYRVFGCQAGGTANDILAAAIYRAAADGADVINLSIGGTPAYSDEVDAVAAQIVGKAGHIVLAANGNDGSAGPYVAGDPGVSLGGLGIASFDNVDIPSYALFVDGRAFHYALGINNANFTFNIPYSGKFVVNNPKAIVNHVLDDGCTSMNVNVAGKAVLLYWGEPNGCGSAARCNTAAAAGAAACIIYYQSESWSFSITGSQAIPSLIIPLSAAKAIFADLAANKKPVVVPTRNLTNFGSLTGGTLSSFSSPGFSNELFIKPDLGGIGGNVYSTISAFAAQSANALTPYAVYSGTSMATPYVAGCTALLLQKRGKIGFDASRAYLQNTATLTNIYNTSLVHSPVYQGAGLVNVYRAASTGTLVTPSALSLNDTVHLSRSSRILITNNYDSTAGEVTFKLSHIPAATVNPFRQGDDMVQDASTTTFTSNNIATVVFPNGKPVYNVTIKPGKGAALRIRIIAPIPASPDLWPSYGGYITITNSIDDIVTTVPYAGVAGVWKNRPIWSRNSSSLYTRWGLGSSSGPLALFGKKPTTVATGLYANNEFMPLTRLATVNAPSIGLILAQAATTSRSANITITYLCNDTALSSIGLPRTNFVAMLDITSQVSSGSQSSYYVFTGAMQRNTYSDTEGILAPHVYGFDGTVFAVAGNNIIGTIKLPAGVYQMNFVAWKNFGDSNNLDVITTPPFQLIYNTPLSSKTLATCQS